MEASLSDLRQRLNDGKRSLKVLQGQLRCSIQVLAELDDRIAALEARRDPTAEEAQEHGTAEDQRAHTLA